MATEKIQMQVTINGDQALSELNDLTSRSALLKQEISGLKKGTEEYAQASSELKQVNQRMGEIRQEVGLQSLPLKELEKLYSQMNREIKLLTPGTDEYVKKSAKLQEVKSRIGEVKTEIYGTQKGMKDLALEAAQANPITAFALNLANSFGTLRGKLVAATTGVKLLNTAFMAGGIGLFIGLMATLYQWFQKSQAGVELARKGFAAFSAVVDAVTERAFRAVEGLGLLGKAAFQFLSGDWKEAADTASQATDKFKESSEGFWDNIVNDVDTALEATNGLIALEKAENDFQLTQAKNKRLIQEQIIATRDLSKSYDERRAALEIANKLELQNQNESLALQQRRVDLMQKEYDRAESVEADRAALIAEQVKLENLKAQSLSRQRELLNRVNELENKRAADEKKRLDEIKKLEAAKLKAKQAFQDLQIELMEEGEEKETALINAKYEREIAAIEANEPLKTERIKALQQLRDRELLEAERQGREMRFNAEIEDLEAEEEARKLKLEELFLNGMTTAAEHDQLVFEQDMQAANDRLAAAEEVFGKESIQYQRANNEKLKLQKEFNDEKLDNEKRTQQLQFQLEQQSFQVASEFMKLGVELLGHDEKSRKKHATAIKAFTIADIWVNYGREVHGYMSHPASTGTLGAVGTAMAVIAGVRAAASTAKVAAQKYKWGGILPFIKKYAFGGMLEGPLHSQGGMPIINPQTGQVVAEVEGGEPILSRATYANNRAVVDRLLHASQNLGGARIMEIGGKAPAPATGGRAFSSETPISPSTTDTAPQPSFNAESNQLLQELVNTNRKLMEQVSAWPRTVKGEWEYKSFKDFEKRINEDEELATL